MEIFTSIAVKVAKNRFPFFASWSLNRKKLAGRFCGQALLLFCLIVSECALFGATVQTTSRTELLVLITPRVLVNQGEAVLATDELRRRFQALEPLQAKIRNQRLGHRSIDISELPGPATLQLVAASSVKEAWETWHRLLQEQTDDVKMLQPRVVRMDEANDRPFSLQVGPIDHPEQGRRLCALLEGTPDDCQTIEAGG
jgi:hypothetical protein